MIASVCTSTLVCVAALSQSLGEIMTLTAHSSEDIPLDGNGAKNRTKGQPNNPNNRTNNVVTSARQVAENLD